MELKMQIKMQKNGLKMQIKMQINLKDFYTLDGLLSQIQQSSSKAILNSTRSKSRKQKPKMHKNANKGQKCKKNLICIILRSLLITDEVMSSALLLSDRSEEKRGQARPGQARPGT